MKLSDCYFLGNITKTHGLDGSVVLKLDTDEPSSYYTLESVFVNINGQPVPFFIEEISVLKTDALKVKFQNVESGMLVGKEVYMPLSDLPPLSGNQFYYHEVIGFEIREDGKKLGEITKVNDAASQPLFLVISENGSEQFIPIINEWIVEVNRDGKFIEMDLPDGIMDL